MSAQTLYYGGPRGRRVQALQRALTASGLPVAPDGIYGRATYAAVVQLQRAAGLEVDGIAGPATLALLGLADAPVAPSAAPPPLRTPFTRADVAAIYPDGVVPCFGWFDEVRAGALHQAIDHGLPVGIPIRAVADGRVAALHRTAQDGRGIFVEVDLGGGWSTLDYHLSRLVVDEGQPVRAGDVLGFSGSTGNSTGPHLHHELQQGGVQRDPERYEPYRDAGLVLDFRPGGRVAA